MSTAPHKSIISIDIIVKVLPDAAGSEDGSDNFGGYFGWALPKDWAVTSQGYAASALT
jgi:hypothetical protein